MNPTNRKHAVEDIQRERLQNIGNNRLHIALACSAAMQTSNIRPFSRALKIFASDKIP